MIREFNIINSFLNMSKVTRVFAISDLHVDMKENLKFVEGWDENKYKNDVVIVGGDVTDNMDLLKTTMQTIQAKFKQVFYVPGNHELWLRRETHYDSIAKFHDILHLCSTIGVITSPTKVCIRDDADTTDSETDELQSNAVWIIPLFSWYAKPEEDANDSLYRPPSVSLHEDVEFSEQVWMDNHLCKWTTIGGSTASQYFARLNESNVQQTYDAPIISFSHFVPRYDLIRQSDEDIIEVNKFRMAHSLGEAPQFQGGILKFNFTRYAGSQTLERQIRQLKPEVHVYGHQHRNRDRQIDSIRYISHCLGNMKEQKEGWTWGLDEWKGPKLIWPQHK